MAREHLKVSQANMKARFDQRAKARSFRPGDKVLALLPLSQGPLATKFQGPYEIEKKPSDVVLGTVLFQNYPTGIG